MDEGYKDVFISHKKEDVALARELLVRIQELGFSGYLDADDPVMDRQPGPEELADRIRSKLRRAKCLIYLATPRSIESKWMPWELGFFDGRWGKPTIGLYLSDLPVEPRVTDAREDTVPAAASPASAAAAAAAAAAVGGDGHALTIQEYLDLYTVVTDDGLEDFLRQATSEAMFANRRDVDIDRYMALVTSALRNWPAFQLGWNQYLLGMLRPGTAAWPALRDWLDHQISLLATLRAAAEQQSTGAAVPAEWLQPWITWLSSLHQAGGQASEAGPQAPPRPAWPAFMQPNPDWSRIWEDWLRQVHAGGVDASAARPPVLDPDLLAQVRQAVLDAGRKA